MQHRPSSFGYRGAYGNQTAPARRGAQPQQEEQYDQQDPAFDTQAYLKIGFHTNKGVKFLNFGKSDKQLREASPLEAMILNYWRSGKDVNELLASMHLEVHDANPDLSDLSFASNGYFHEEEEPTFVAPTAPKARKPRASQQQAADDQE